ncbi:MAG: D-alanyl-D-alanine carboxypeptidase/D-alanyl-D-alanine-endopeptidase [Bacteroidota bacterium]
MKKILVVLVLLCSIPLCKAQLVDRLEPIFAREEVATAQVSVSVRAKDGSVIFQRQPKILLIPASTLKLVTTLSALDILGAEHQYRTEISYRGQISDDGTLIGDLFVVGSGDPSLGSGEDPLATDMDEVINQVIRFVRAENITAIQGKIVLDDTIFDGEAVHPGWPWDDLCNYYAAGSWGINFHENRYQVVFSRSSKTDIQTTINSIVPLFPGALHHNMICTGPLGSGDNAYIYGDPYAAERSIRGTIPPGRGAFEIEGAVPDGPMFFGSLLEQALAREGISVTGVVRGNSSTHSYQSLGSLSSPRLLDLVSFANHESDNLYCDAFLKSVGAVAEGQGSWASGVRAIRDHINSLDVMSSGLRQVDGSGLSSRNRLSPDFMTSFLVRQLRSHGTQTLQYIIPEVGSDGTVKRFMEEREGQDYYWLKSGSINSVVAYAGLLVLNPEEPIVVSIMANGHSVSNRVMRNHLADILEEIYQELK